VARAVVVREGGRKGYRQREQAGEGERAPEHGEREIAQGATGRNGSARETERES
jgi:hypothetical protein